MPVTFYDIDAKSKLNQVKDQDQYEKLPIWLTRQEVKYFADYNVYQPLFGSIKWKANMGPNLRGVRAERTPVGRQVFLPKPITDRPAKDVIDQNEVTNDAVLRSHYIDSLVFHFLPSFQDFRDEQIAPVHKEMTRQRGYAQDMFLRTYLLEMAPYVYVAGKNTALTDAPSNTGDPGFEEADMYKTAAFWQARIAEIQGQGLSLKQLSHAVAVIRDDIGSCHFEGLQGGAPGANEMVKGKYVLTGSSELWEQWLWDTDLRNMLGENPNLIADGFRGSIFGQTTFKTVKHPLRVAQDGTFPVPEIEDEDTGKTVPNPDYVNAPYEIAFLLGADALQALQVGPPPAAFGGGAGGSRGMSLRKFRGMNWNGEIELTDDILQLNDDGTYDTNRRRELLQLQSTIVLGAISNESRSCMPILFARKRAV